MNYLPSKPELKRLGYGRERPILVRGCLYRPIGHDSTLGLYSIRSKIPVENLGREFGKTSWGPPAGVSHQKAAEECVLVFRTTRFQRRFLFIEVRNGSSAVLFIQVKSETFENRFSLSISNSHMLVSKFPTEISNRDFRPYRIQPYYFKFQVTKIS